MYDVSCGGISASFVGAGLPARILAGSARDSRVRWASVRQFCGQPHVGGAKTHPSPSIHSRTMGYKGGRDQQDGLRQVRDTAG